jgi:hypothetical protein
MILEILLLAAQVVVGPPITTGTTVITPQPITGTMSFSPQPVAKDVTGKLNTYQFQTLVDRSTLTAGKQIFVTVEQSPDGLSWSFLCGMVVTSSSNGPATAVLNCPINAKISQQIRGTIAAKASTGQMTDGHPDATKESDATITTSANVAVK